MARIGSLRLIVGRCRVGLKRAGGGHHDFIRQSHGLQVPGESKDDRCAPLRLARHRTGAQSRRLHERHRAWWKHHNAYDVNGRLTRVVNGFGRATTYAYDGGRQYDFDLECRRGGDAARGLAQQRDLRDGLRHRLQLHSLAEYRHLQRRLGNGRFLDADHNCGDCLGTVLSDAVQRAGQRNLAERLGQQHLYAGLVSWTNHLTEETADFLFLVHQ